MRFFSTNPFAAENVLGLLRLTLTGTVLLGLALLACAILRRSTPAERHLLLGTAFLVTLLSPFIALALPESRISVLAALESELRYLIEWSQAQPFALSIDSAIERSLNGGPTPSSQNLFWNPLFHLMIFVVIWIPGFIWKGLRLLAGAAGTLRMRLYPLATDPRVATIAQRLSLAPGMQRIPRITIGDVPSPAVFGSIFPVVVLPSASASWDDERLALVLKHEFAHVVRRDAAWQTVANLACALLWFNPVVRIAARKLRAESERAADASVIESGVAPSRYAEELLTLWREAGTQKSRKNSPILTMALGPGVDARIRAVLSNSVDAAGVLRVRRTQVFIACLVIILLIGASGDSGGSVGGQEVRSDDLSPIQPGLGPIGR